MFKGKKQKTIDNYFSQSSYPINYYLSHLFTLFMYFVLYVLNTYICLWNTYVYILCAFKKKCVRELGGYTNGYLKLLIWSVCVFLRTYIPTKKVISYIWDTAKILLRKSNVELTCFLCFLNFKAKNVINFIPYISNTL